MSKLPSRPGSFDQPFPPDRGARFLEVQAHDDFETAVQATPQLRQARAVFKRGFRVMDRARTDDDSQPVVLPVQDAPESFARFDDRPRCGVGTWKLAQDFGWRA